METTIDEVSIQIESNSKAAISSLDKLTKSLQSLSNATSTTVQSLNEINSGISTLKSSSNGLSTVQKNIDATSKKTKKVDTTGFDRLKNSMAKTVEKSNSLNELVQNLRALENTTNKINTSGFEKLKAEIASAIRSGENLDELKQKIQESMNAAKNVKLTPMERMQNMFGRIKNIAEQSKSTIKSIPETISKIGNVMSKVIGAFKSMNNIVKATKSAMKKAFDPKNFSSLLKKTSKYILALFSIRGAYALVNSAANRWLSSSSAAAQQLSANIDYLKFSLGSALAPVIEYITSLIIRLLRLVQSLVYTLSGFNIFGKAFAKNMSSAAGSAKEIKKQLAGFDELNVLDFGSGGGSGGGGSITPDIDLTSVEEIQSELLDKIKAGDWYGLGMEIGRKIGEGLDSIPWNKIQNKVKKIATNVADLMNGLWDGIPWDKVGQTIGNGLNTAALGAITYLDRRKFVEKRKIYSRNV